MTGDHDTITLKDAAQHFGFGVWTLRAEAARGRLTTYKIGRQYYTTPADIKQMVELCRVEPKAQGSTLTLRETNGLSATARASSARESLGLTLARLKGSSPGTSARSTSPSRQTARR